MSACAPQHPRTLSRGDDHLSSTAESLHDTSVSKSLTLEGSNNHAGPSSEQPPQHNPNIRSCVTCRRRKVRCNKQNPCSNCVKAGTECVFPGPGRAPRRTKRPQDAELLSRLRRLEGVIEQLSGQSPPPSNSAANANANINEDGRARLSRIADLPSANDHSQTDLPRRCGGGLDSDPRQVAPRDLENEFGRLVIEEDRSRYVSNRFWANLGDEIEELQDILDPTSSDEEDGSSPEASPLSSGNHDGFLLGFYSLSHSLRKFHPPPRIITFLWQTYEENVSPMIPFLHKPTTRARMQEVARNLDILNKHSEPLVFAIYFAATVSLTPEQCLSQLGEDRDVLVRRYRFAVEQALSKAGLLNTQSLLVLQAAVLFLICVRREDDTKFVWTMTAVVLRVASGLGVHRDGTNFGLKPFDTEMRRRLWWHICLLDLRSSEEHGTDAQIHDMMSDTRLPLNVNDDDLVPDMQKPPDERVGCTDMTFCLIRCETLAVMRRVNNSCPPGLAAGHGRRPTLQEEETMIENINKRIHDRYVKYCDTSIPYQWACATVARLILAKLWLGLHNPLTRQVSAINLSQATRDSLFLTSIEVVEFGYLLEHSPRTAHWGWLFRTFLQWHAVAFVLSEVCVRPICPMLDRAWLAAKLVYEPWEKEGKLRKGMMWRPLSRLMKRAAVSRARKEEELLAQYGPNPASLQTSQTRLTPLGVGVSQMMLETYALPRVPASVPESTFRKEVSPTTAARDTSQPRGTRHIPQSRSPQQPQLDLLNFDLTMHPLDFISHIVQGQNLSADPASLLAQPGVAQRSSSDGTATVPSNTVDSSTTNPMDTSEDTTTATTAAAVTTSTTITDNNHNHNNTATTSSSQLNWSEWDQVMRDFRQDLQNTVADRPADVVTDWVV